MWKDNQKAWSKIRKISLMFVAYVSIHISYKEYKKMLLLHA